MTGSRLSRGARSILFTPSTAGFPLRATSSAIQRVASPISTRPAGPVPASTSMSARSTSDSVESPTATMRRFSSPVARWRPGVSKKASCAPSPFQTPRMRVRVVCGRGDTIAIFSRRTRLRSVDLPTFGRPTMATNPALIPVALCAAREARGPRRAALRLRATRDRHLLELRLAVAGASDLGDELEALHHLAEDGVAPVQVRRGDLGDEELG